MDAVEFLKAAERRSLYDPLRYGEFISLRGNDWAALVAQIRQWSKDHPARTRQSEFLKMFPNAAIFPDSGVLHIAPCKLDISFQDRDECKEYSCAECCEKYWLQEVE